jgi:response regulator RpfG family c-di-GMP phosphodiesterase
MNEPTSASAADRPYRVLFVDDEPNVLDAVRRQLRKRCHVMTATSGEQGLEVIRERGPIAVVVSDMRMPGMSGTRFLRLVRDLSPDTVRIVLSGQADLQDTIEAVNEGQVFRFLLKPSSPETLWAAVEAGLQLHRMLTTDRELLPHVP